MIKERHLIREAKDFKGFCAVDHVINDAVALRMYKALSVIAHSADTRRYLSANDYQALNQVLGAINEYQSSYQESTAD